VTANKPVDRNGARVIVRDRSGRLLLFQGADPHNAADRWWITPGGGLDPGETFEEAAARELLEETGLRASEFSAVVHTEVVEFSFESVSYRQLQHFFAVEVPLEGPSIELRHEGWTDLEARSIRQTKWWTPEELRATDEEFYPTDLVELAAKVDVWGQALPD
jgi:8-oxo-dGTP pyrophosphatase MutT (NUDIX family)